MYLHLDQLRSSTALAAWIRRIAHNTYVSCLRKKQLSTISLPENYEPILCIAHDQEDFVSLIELLDAIHRVLNPTNCKILMERLCGYRISDIAAQHDLTPQAVRGRLCRIRKRLEYAIQ